VFRDKLRVLEMSVFIGWCQCLLDADLKLERLLIDNDEEVNIIIITLD